MECDPVKKCLVVNGPSMGSPSSEGFEICFASSADVGLFDGEEGDELDRVNLDPAIAHAIATARLHLRPLPQPERHRYVPRQHLGAQFPAELHGLTLRQPVWWITMRGWLTGTTTLQSAGSMTHCCTLGVLNSRQC